MVEYIDSNEKKSDYELVRASNSYNVLFNDVFDEIRDNPDSYQGDEKAAFELVDRHAAQMENAILDELVNLAKTSDKAKNDNKE